MYNFPNDYYLNKCQHFVISFLKITGATLIVLQMWRQKSAPFVVGVHLVFTVAGIITGPIIKLLAESYEKEHTILSFQNNMSTALFDSFGNVTEAAISHSKDIAYRVILSSYYINGCVILLAAFMFFAVTLLVFFSSKPADRSLSNLRRVLHFCKSSKAHFLHSGKRSDTKLVKRSKICLFLFAVLLTNLIGIENGFVSLLVTFIVDQLVSRTAKQKR